jgi:hypothetical protein
LHLGGGGLILRGHFKVGSHDTRMHGVDGENQSTKQSEILIMGSLLACSLARSTKAFPKGVMNKTR